MDARVRKMIDYWELIGGAKLQPWQEVLIEHAVNGDRDAVYGVADRRAGKPMPARVQELLQQHIGERHPGTGLVVCFIPDAAWVPAFDRIPIMSGLVKL